MPGAGFEPAPPCGDEILSLACLPVSPPGPDLSHDAVQAGEVYSLAVVWASADPILAVFIWTSAIRLAILY